MTDPLHVRARSSALFAAAAAVIPGGVNSPVRAFRSVGGHPLFFAKARGPYVWSEDGDRYVDYVGSWGPMILGHADTAVIRAVQETAANGLSFGAPTAAETTLARAVIECVPSMDLVRFCSSGTEATMSALRLARGFTGRDRILKFEGCYHGHSDSLLVKAGSGALTLGVPTSPGVPADLAKHTLTLPYNDLAAVRELFATDGATLAAVIVEPVAGNMNCVLPAPGFLELLREQCTRHGAVLIFDEVMTGFRVARGGAQQYFGVRPDLTTLGKIIGGGMPVGAFGGRREIMEWLSPLGPVYQAGTLSGNPVAMAAGLATLAGLSVPGFHERLAALTAQLCAGLETAARAAGIPFVTTQVPGMFGLYFTDQTSITSFADVQRCDVTRFRHFFHAMLDEGVYLAPSAYEAGFISAVHDESTMEATFRAAHAAFRRC